MVVDCITLKRAVVYARLENISSFSDETSGCLGNGILMQMRTCRLLRQQISELFHIVLSSPSSSHHIHSTQHPNPFQSMLKLFHLDKSH